MTVPFVLTVKETCEALRLGRTTVYKLIDAGQLKTVKIGTATRVVTDSVRALAGHEAANDNGGEA